MNPLCHRAYSPLSVCARRVSLGLAAALLLLSLPAQAVEIIAHRGASFDAPENTLASMKLGFKQGAEGGECDVYFTKDGQLMIMHDRDTWRTTGVSNLMTQTTSARLRQLEAGQWGQWQGKGYAEKIPFLAEELAAVPAGKKIVLHLGSGPEMLPELQRQLEASGKAAQEIVVIAFNYELVKQVKALMPRYGVMWLPPVSAKGKPLPTAETLIDKAKAARLDGLDVSFDYPIDRQFVQKIHQAGLQLYTWTVDDPEVARREAAAGVDGITTNRPQWLREQLR
jgi:glycerophosphoryl diester phosphodiesterase